MSNTKAPFLLSLLYGVLAPFFLVMLVAFLSIPYSLGNAPGDVRLADSASYHLT